MKVAVAVTTAMLMFPASALAGPSHTSRTRAVREFHADTGQRATSSNATCMTRMHWKTWYCNVRVRRGSTIGLFSISVSKRTNKGRVTSRQYIS